MRIKPAVSKSSDLDTGSVVGQPFKELVVDAELFAVEIGNMKAWYPPVTVIDFKVRPGRPVVLKVTNNSAAEHGFQMTDPVECGFSVCAEGGSGVEAW